MSRRQPPDLLGSALSLRIYSALALLGGSIMTVWGPAWLGTPALTRILAAFVVASGCWAAMLSQMGESWLRRRGSSWFVAAHMVVLCVLFSQRVALWGPARSATAGDYFFMVVICFNLLSRGERSARGERSGDRYEQQIREAGAQQERNRLARDLHDSIKQQIFVIQTAAATAQTRFDNDRDGAASALDQIRSSARDAMTEMEAMMDQLRSVPLENASLIDALKKQCEALGHRTGARVEFKVDDLPPSKTFAPGAHQAIFRIAQEAFANIGRHARASNVTVSLLSLSDRLEMRIQDDGGGFDQFQSQRGMGMANMRERAAEFGGRFNLTSSPGGGTTITVSIPHDELPTGYRRRTYLLGTALIGILLYAAQNRSVGMIFPIALGVGALVSSVRDWLRAREYAESRA